LTHYWPFNGDFIDYAGGANTTPIGPVSFAADRFNTANKAAYLNNGYLALPAGEYYYRMTLTMMGWIYLKAASTTVYAFVFSMGLVSSNDGVCVQVNPSGTNNIAQNNGATYSSGGPKNLYANTWIHFSFTFDSTLGRTLSYINGTQIENSYTSGNLRTQYTVMNYLGVQSMANRWVPPAVGSDVVIDDFRIYNRSVNASEIRAIMNLA
jgi:hypothetical protein